jgi:hypothetical protein
VTRRPATANLGLGRHLNDRPEQRPRRGGRGREDCRDDETPSSLSIRVARRLQPPQAANPLSHRAESDGANMALLGSGPGSGRCLQVACSPADSNYNSGAGTKSLCHAAGTAQAPTATQRRMHAATSASSARPPALPARASSRSGTTRCSRRSSNRSPHCRSGRTCTRPEQTSSSTATFMRTSGLRRRRRTERRIPRMASVSSSSAQAARASRPLEVRSRTAKSEIRAPTAYSS